MTERQPKQRRRLQPYHHSELADLPKREPLVKRLLDRGAMSVIYGASGCGKTFLALDLAWHVALGWEWFGRSVRRSKVYYLSAEGGPGSVERRVTAFVHHHDIRGPGAPLYIWPAAADLRNPDADASPLIEEIKRLGGVDLVVIDTLSRVMAGGNENAPDDMGALVATVDRIRAETGAHVLVVHHTGKDTARGARGHSLLRAATDTEIEVSKDEVSGIITAAVTKQRDHETGAAMTFKLEPVEIGMDEDGERVTSCVVVPVESQTNRTARRPLSGQGKLALDLLRRAIDEHGEITAETAHIPAGARAVSLDLWRRYVAAGSVTDSDNPETQRKAFRRAANALLASGHVATWGDLVWLPDGTRDTGRDNGTSL